MSFLDRFKEASSYAGIAAAAAGILPTLGMAPEIVSAITGIFGAIAFLLKDKTVAK